MTSKCIARKWKGENGESSIGSRCNRPTKIGEFCGIHGKKIKNPKICKESKCKGFNKTHEFAWEHLGRCDEVIPDFFTQPNNKLSKELQKNKLSKELPKNKLSKELPKNKLSKEKDKSSIEKNMEKSKPKPSIEKSKEILSIEKPIDEITWSSDDSWSSDDDYDLGEEKEESVKYEGVKSRDGKFYFLDKKTNIIYIDYYGKKRGGIWDEKTKMPILD